VNGFSQAVDNYIKGCGIGTSVKRSAVIKTAGDIDAMPDGKFKDMVSTGFFTWLTQGKWLLDDLHHEPLPPSCSMSDAEVAREYRLTSEAGIRRKQEELYDAAQTRIQRAVDHLEAGWGPEEIRCFVCSVEELEAAQRKGGTYDF
jgi:hypothetical protein